MQALLVSLLCSTVAFALTVLVSLARAPKLIDDKLHSKINSLAKPARTSIQESRILIVKSAIAKNGAGAIKLLKHLRTLGKMVFESGSKPLPRGMDSETVKQLLESLKLDGIIDQDRTPIARQSGIDDILRTGTSYKVIWTINPEMVAAVDEVLSEAPPASLVP